jgi:hypothetical protein
MSSIDDAQDHILISAEDAEDLISPLTDDFNHPRDNVSAGDLKIYCVID